MRERDFNTIISGMIVSHYSAVASSTGMREECLLRGGRHVCCCSRHVRHFVDHHNSFSLTLPLFLEPKCEECRLICVVSRFNRQIEGLRGRAACRCACVLCVCKQHARVCLCVWFLFLSVETPVDGGTPC